MTMEPFNNLQELAHQIFRRPAALQISPTKPSRFAMRLGHEGTCAILGFGHSLLQLSSYDGELLHILQGHPFSEEPELLLAQAQLDGLATSSGFGLQVLKPNDAFVNVSERGFIAYKWPIQTFVYKSGSSTDHWFGPRVHHALTYIQDRSLIQVAAVASFFGKDELLINWSLGGNILLKGQSGRPSQDVSEDGSVLTIGYARDGASHEVDIELFINGVPYNFTKTGLPPSHCDNCSNIIRGGHLTAVAALIVARFTPRNRTKVPERSQPSWNDIKRHFSFTHKEKHPLAMKLKKNLGVKNGSRLRGLIIHSVERLLNVAVLPSLMAPKGDSSAAESEESSSSSPKDRNEQWYPRYLLLDNLVQANDGRLSVDYEASFWHVRFLTAVLDFLKKDTRKTGNAGPYNSNSSSDSSDSDDSDDSDESSEFSAVYDLKDDEATNFCNRLSEVIAGILRRLLDVRPDDAKSRAFRALALVYASHHQDQLPIKVLLENLMTTNADIWPKKLSKDEQKDPTCYLLNWLHEVTISIWSNIGGAQTTEKYEGANDFDLSRLDIHTSLAKDRRENQKLDETRLNLLATLPAELLALHAAIGTEHTSDDRKQSDDVQQPTNVNQLEDKKQIAKYLLDAKDLLEWVTRNQESRKAATKLGKTPPWEFLCLNHILPIHLEIAKGGPKGDQHETPSGCSRSTLEKSFQRCQYFLQSDYSLMSSWDPNETTSKDSRWRLDCSSIALTAFLAVLTPQDSNKPPLRSKPPASGVPYQGVTRQKSIDTRRDNQLSTIETKLEEIIRVLKANSGTSAPKDFPWESTLVKANPFYPQFMQAVSSKGVTTNTIARLIQLKASLTRTGNKNADKRTIEGFCDINKQWSLTNGEAPPGSTTTIKMRVVDFNEDDQMSYSLQFAHRDSSLYGIPEDNIRRVFEDSRIANKVNFRIVIHDRLPVQFLSIFTNSVQSDAWDTIFSYYGSTPNFQGARRGRETYDAAGKLTSVVSISLPHFSLASKEREDCIRPRFELFQPTDTHAGPLLTDPNKEDRYIMEVASSICMTGDKFGEFWTCSLLGIPDLEVLSDDLGPLRGILDVCSYDKISARNFIFIFLLTKVCDVISKRYEDVLNVLVERIDLYKGRDLYSNIVVVDEFGGTRATDALQKALWGTKWLDIIGDSLKAAQPVIEQAREETNRRLLERRPYWEDDLKESEDKLVWEGYRVALARLKACHDRVVDYNRATTSVADYLVKLSSLSASQHSLITQERAERGGWIAVLIAVLTLLFLPLTFMAVLLTTPMFKWPDPPEGKIIIKLPFTIYWAVSGTVTGLLLCVTAPVLFRFSGVHWKFWHMSVTLKASKPKATQNKVTVQDKATAQDKVADLV